MTIFGNNATGTGEFTAAVGRKTSSSFVLASPTTVQELHANVKSGTGNTYVLHIYADSAGLPGARVGYTSGIVHAGSGSTIVDISQTGLSISLAAGTYWLGVTFTNAQGFVRTTLSAGALRAILSGAAVSPPSDPWGTSDFNNADLLCVWAVTGTGGGGGAAGSILERKAGSASVDTDDYNALVDAVVALGGAVSTRKAGSGQVSPPDFNAVVDAVVALGGTVRDRKAGAGAVDTDDFNAVIDAVKLLGAP